MARYVTSHNRTLLSHNQTLLSQYLVHLASILAPLCTFVNSLPFYPMCRLHTAKLVTKGQVSIINPARVDS